MDKLEKIYDESLNFASGHYENFPVASVIVPKKLRKHIAVIYRFAREADDIADEGSLPADKRLVLLDNYEDCFIRAMSHSYENSFWQALNSTIENMNLTPDLFTDLLSAFKQDVVKKRYCEFSEIADYCRRSANPVGRLLLELFGYREARLFEYSDNICSALQLANFYQDVSADLAKGRIYIPLAEMEEYGYSEYEFSGRSFNASFRRLMAFQVQRASEMFRAGRPLVPNLAGRLKYEIKWTIGGGEKILEKITKIDYNVFKERPVLNKSDFIGILIKSIIS